MSTCFIDDDRLYVVPTTNKKDSEREGHDVNIRTITIKKEGVPFGFISLLEPASHWPSIGGVRILDAPFSFSGSSLARDLATTMHKKAAAVDLPMSGAKSVLYLPKDGCRTSYLSAFAQVLNQLDGRYVVAVDVGSDVEDMNILSQHTPFVTCHARAGGDPSCYTAQGVLKGILAACEHRFKDASLSYKKIVVQGAGKVGRYLISFIKKHFPLAELIVADPSKEQCQRVKENVTFIEAQQATSVPCDVFISAATSNIIDMEDIDRMQCTLFSSAANNPFESEQALSALIEKGCCVLPDYLINSGGLLHCAYQYGLLTRQEMLDKIDTIFDKTALHLRWLSS